jgi:hypothetical protein
MRVAFRSAAGLGAALLIASALPALGAARDVGGNDIGGFTAARSDAEIIRDVRRAILGYANTTVFDHYAFKVEGGVVTLLGSVQMPYRSKDVEKRVARVAGVRAVDNRIEVQPASSFDDDVRRELARAIYRSDRFVQYGLGANPSVRILVSRGRVTLAGVVASRVDQVQLGMIARQIAPFGVDNRLVVESEQPKEPPSRNRLSV